jgi:hypothetical protein
MFSYFAEALIIVAPHSMWRTHVDDDPSGFFLSFMQVSSIDMHLLNRASEGMAKCKRFIDMRK